MDTKDLSPAYLTSLAALFAGALTVGASSTWVSVLGWVVLLAGMGLNVFATLVMVQRPQGRAPARYDRRCGRRRPGRV